MIKKIHSIMLLISIMLIVSACQQLDTAINVLEKGKQVADKVEQANNKIKEYTDVDNLGSSLSEITNDAVNLNLLEKKLIDNENVATNKAYKVVKIVDGDTIEVEIDKVKQKIRLIGVDTPETVDPRKTVQCFGKEASNKTKELLSDKMVNLEEDKTQGNTDKYGRLLRYVFLEDGTFINKYLIYNGFAHEYTYNLPYKYQTEFKEAEKSARENKRGLWSPDSCSGITK